MKTSGIDFPKPLLDALKNNQLVVFAGAGVLYARARRTPVIQPSSGGDRSG